MKENNNKMHDEGTYEEVPNEVTLIKGNEEEKEKYKT
jgi:hypothetical protein